MTASAFVWLMIPGAGLYYSGLTAQRSSISLALLSAITVSVVTFQVRSVDHVSKTLVVLFRLFSRVLTDLRGIYWEFR